MIDYGVLQLQRAFSFPDHRLEFYLSEIPENCLSLQAVERMASFLGRQRPMVDPALAAFSALLFYAGASLRSIPGR